MSLHYFALARKGFLVFLMSFICGYSSWAQTPTPSVSFSNNNNNNISLHEACVGDRVTFNYRNFSKHPDRIQFSNNSPISVIPTNKIKNNNLHQGTIVFTVSNAFANGINNIDIKRGNNILYTTYLFVHKPPIDFFIPSTPLCASDTNIILHPTPSGGFFTVDTNKVDSGFVTSNILNATKINWPSNHQPSDTISIVYNYIPKYSNQASCLDALQDTQNLVFYDNRLTALSFKTVEKKRNRSNIQVLTLDSIQNTIIASTTPNIFCNTTALPSCYSYDFSGTFVQQNSADYYFLGNAARTDTVNPIRLEFDNNGCIGTASGDLSIKEFSGIFGLPDTICRYSTLIDTIRRDPSIDYTFINTSNYTNQFYEVLIQGGSYMRPYITLNNNDYEFIFNHNNYINTNDSILIIEAIYRTTNIGFFTITDTIVIIDPPQNTLANVKNYYCANSTQDVLEVSPALNSNAANQLLVNGRRINNNSINPDSLYGMNIGDLILPITYTVNYYGCRNTAYQNITIKAPLNPRFTPPQTTLCKNDNPIALNPSTTPSGIQHRFTPINGLDSLTNTFNPSLADTGTHPIVYTYTDIYNCSYADTQNITVNPKPTLDLILDGSTADKIFCTNASSKAIQVRTNALNNRPSISGGGVFSDTLYPYQVFNGGSGTSYITATISTQFGCNNKDSLKITILPPPSVNISSTFNNTPSRDVQGNIITPHRYCQNTARFSLTPQPFTNDATAITGNGITYDPNDSTYYYDPARAIQVDSIDKIIYTYTNTDNCTNTDSTLIKIDPTPNVQFNHSRDTNLCLNNVPISFPVSPNPSTGTGRYGGQGGLSTNGIFDPALVGGNNTTIIFYEFTDSNGCINNDTIQVTVHPLTTLSFTGNRAQYCESDLPDTLSSSNDTTRGTFRFFGNIITDSIGVLNPSVNNNSLGTRTETISYVYTDSLGCTDTLKKNIFISKNPEIKLSGLDSAYCSNSANDLISLVPTGGFLSNYDSTIFSINSGNQFVVTPKVNSSNPVSRYYNFTYTFTNSNNCSDTLTTQTYIHTPIVSYIQTRDTASNILRSLDALYCSVADTIRLLGAPSGGYFSGSGVNQDSAYFIPNKASIGQNRITYHINDGSYIQASGDTLICSIDTTVIVMVQALPTPTLASPTNNTAFCSTDSLQQLYPDNSVALFHLFTSLNNGIISKITTIGDTISFNPDIIRYINDTTFYFSPSTVGAGTHFVTHTVKDSFGCTDSSRIGFLVESPPNINLALDSVYCTSTGAKPFVPIPSGGVVTRNSDTLSINSSNNNFYLYLSSQDSIGRPLTQTLVDTIVYTLDHNICPVSQKLLVTINPTPSLSFSLDSNANIVNNIFCLGGDTVTLIPNAGILIGNGIQSSSNLFIPSWAGPGKHIISLRDTFGTTQCSAEFVDTFYVYGTPNLDFEVQGSCQYDTLTFLPNNSILNLNSTFQNQYIDSITNVQWIFSPTTSAPGNAQARTIDPKQHVYDSAGIYFPQLIVANRTHCIDTQTIRWVVSPKINTYPYVEDFENSAGNWFAESRDSSHRLLWEWGVDSDQRGIPSDNNNHIWITQGNDAYKEGESAWVYSPCFDISSLDRPMISLDYWNHTRLPFDGAVIEYQMADGSWAPLGAKNRGVDWFNTSFIAGEPGGDSNRVFHLGWSGESDYWQNGRYKLDDFRGNNDVLRMRVAFASINNTPQYFFDGFAFDNVVIKNRTRNVLLETTIHDRHENMLDINNKTYGLVYSSRYNIFKDVILLQHPIEYSKELPSINNANIIRDFFFEQNENLSNNNIRYENIGETRVFEYGNEKAGRAYINGDNPIYLADSLSESTFDKDMLQDPKFEIKINNFIHHNNKFKVEASIKALEEFDSTVRVYIVISEDQLYYPTNSYYGSNNALYAIARISSTSLNSNSSNPNTFMQSWSIGQLENINFEWDHANSRIINYSPNKFHAVVFVQNINTKEVYQVTTSRVNSGYWVGINPIQAEEELNELQSLRLFPNPAHDYFNLQFDQALEHDYEWKLVNMQGVEVQQGQLQMGTDQVQIDGLDYPSGAYILLLYNKKVFVQRKVVLGRP